jgi:hypothetical protein
MTISPDSDDASRRPIRRALVSVYDKTNLLVAAQALVEAGAEIVSTGSTAATIAGAGLPVTAIEQVTGFPECLDGRVKTLHPKVHAGLLADLRLESHRAQLDDLGIEPFDLLISNLYPFTATVASGASPEECIEQIDIGGPAMVRSSAKNHASVAVITSPDQYPQLTEAIAAGGFTLAERQALAAAAFVHTATYDVAVASWMGNVVSDLSEGTGFPRWMGGRGRRSPVSGTGRTPHQPAALYRVTWRGWWPRERSAAAWQGDVVQTTTSMLDAARRSAGDFDEPAVAVIKHANPCGIAIGTDIAESSSQSPLLRSGFGVRRGDRGQPAGQCGDGAPSCRHLHRSDHRALLRRGGARGAHGQEESSNPGGRAASSWGRREPSHRRWLAGSAPRIELMLIMTGLSIGSWLRASLFPMRALADLEFAWRRLARSSRTRSCSPVKVHRWASAWGR